MFILYKFHITFIALSLFCRCEFNVFLLIRLRDLPIPICVLEFLSDWVPIIFIFLNRTVFFFFFFSLVHSSMKHCSGHSERSLSSLFAAAVRHCMSASLSSDRTWARDPDPKPRGHKHFLSYRARLFLLVVNAWGF